MYHFDVLWWVPAILLERIHINQSHLSSDTNSSPPNIRPFVTTTIAITAVTIPSYSGLG